MRSDHLQRRQVYGGTSRFRDVSEPGGRFALLSSIGLLSLAAAAGCQSSTGSVAMTTASQPVALARYFFVVPGDLPGGGSGAPQRKIIEAWLVHQAGGYTRLGPSHGGWHDGRDLIEEDGIAYFVVGPDGLKPQLEKLILEQFKQRQAFVVQW